MTLLVVITLSTQISAQDIVITGSEVPVTETESGTVRGYIHNDIYTFKGIPYAQAKRFEAAEKPAKWDGVKSTTMYGAVSPLITPTTSIQDESEFVFDHDWGRIQFPVFKVISFNVHVKRKISLRVVVAAAFNEIKVGRPVL